MALNLTGPDTIGLWEIQAIAAGIKEGRVSGYRLDVDSPDAWTVITTKARRFHESLQVNGRPQDEVLGQRLLHHPGRLGGITLAYLYGFAYGQAQQAPAPRYRTLLQGKLAKLLDHHDSITYLADALGFNRQRLLVLLTGPDQPDAIEEASIARAFAEVLMAGQL